jgi:hypothetical protein
MSVRDLSRAASVGRHVSLRGNHRRRPHAHRVPYHFTHPQLTPTMPATCSRKIACPDWGHSYARPIWLARHQANVHRRARARTRARSIESAPPPPPRVPHPQPDMSSAPNHDPVTDDVVGSEMVGGGGSRWRWGGVRVGDAP